MFRRQSKQGLCRAWVRQPGVNEFREGIVGQRAPGDRVVVIQISQGPADRHRYKLSLKALVAELLPVYVGDIPYGECLPIKELSDKIRMKEFFRHRRACGLVQNEFVQTFPDVLPGAFADIYHVLWRLHDEVIKTAFSFHDHLFLYRQLFGEPFLPGDAGRLM